MVLPPLPVCIGARPRYAANCLPEENTDGSDRSTHHVGHDDRTNARHAEQILGVLGLMGKMHDLAFECNESFSVFTDLPDRVAQCVDDELYGITLKCIDAFVPLFAELRRRPRYYLSVLCQQAANVIDVDGTLFDNLGAHRQHRLQIAFGSVFVGDLPHSLHHGIEDAFGIGPVTFVVLHERLDELGVHMPHRVTERLELACPILGAAVGFHADQPLAAVSKALKQISTLDLLVGDLSSLHKCRLGKHSWQCRCRRGT